ncbi:nitroreductase/quinone reductase family protein [Streptomyces sp. NPDC093675]|uniref:nitroreductase/quinone reductase family protein n=1 Tax=Streptomyces sp. NPDC093675 TaxID=3366049 RepID=UPI00380AA794
MTYNDQVIATFRANNGQVGGPFDGKHLLLLHTRGRRTGRRLVNPLLYLPDGDALVVGGSDGGAEKDPQWVANMAAMGTVTVELADRMITVRPRILREGAEYDRLYARLLEYWPDLHSYSARTSRRIPIVRLEPELPAPEGDSPPGAAATRATPPG